MKACFLFAAAPDEISGVARDLDLLGFSASVHTLEGPPSERPDLAGVWTGDDAAGALQFCHVLSKDETMRGVPLILLVRLEQLRELFLRESVYDDFLVVPYQLAELDARLRQLLWRARQGEPADVLTFGPLVINLATYQVQLEGQPIDLTYMEYELLKYLASHKGRVFTREGLLSQVWGYDYYGGSRTVDVHVRRLRAKLGDHASLIQTVRNVGYKFVG